MTVRFLTLPGVKEMSKASSAGTNTRMNDTIWLYLWKNSRRIRPMFKA
ncbi:hypothetical protein NXV95_16035 [Bacteroides fragilis]|nr:hypothetical protein [Bacteroides fragilis]